MLFLKNIGMDQGPRRVGGGGGQYVTCMNFEGVFTFQVCDVALLSQVCNVILPTQVCDVALPSQVCNIILPAQVCDVALPSQVCNIILPAQVCDVALPSQVWNIILPSQVCDVALLSQVCNIILPSQVCNSTIECWPLFFSSMFRWGDIMGTTRWEQNVWHDNFSLWTWSHDLQRQCQQRCVTVCVWQLRPHVRIQLFCATSTTPVCSWWITGCSFWLEGEGVV